MVYLKPNAFSNMFQHTLPVKELPEGSFAYKKRGSGKFPERKGLLYIGSQGYTHSEKILVNVFDYDTHKWAQRNGSLRVQRYLPKVTDDMKFSIIPYIDMESRLYTSSMEYLRKNGNPYINGLYADNIDVSPGYGWTVDAEL